MDMDVALLLGAIIALIVLDLAALRWGADSRHQTGRNWW